MKVFIAIASILLLSCGNNENRNGPQEEISVTHDTTGPAGGTNIHNDSIGTKFLQGPAGTLFVDDGGRGGTPVIFLHSYGGSTEQMQAQLSHLRKSRRAIAFDFRAHGQSASHDSNYSVQSLSSDLAAVVNQLGLDSFILVGHSLGGSVAALYAAANPSKVKAILLVGTPGKTPPAIADKVVSSLRTDQYEEVMSDYMNKLLEKAKPETRSVVMKGFEKLARSTSISLIRAAFDYDPVPDLKKIEGEKLIVYSDLEDPVNSLGKQAPSVKKILISGSSHWMQMDKKEEFNTILDQFL
ncbi:MAG: alpha/beta hydrolase, partial [Gemmatimonadaceae bacterium]|nr:alpha/beta hydrolase [Chitinophagaceae bacterium]